MDDQEMAFADEEGDLATCEGTHTVLGGDEVKRTKERRFGGRK